MQSIQIDYRKKWMSMAAVAMGIFLGTIDSSIVNIALPTLVKSLQTDFSTIQWVVLSYLLTITTLLLIIGRLGDMLGKKHLYTVGFIVFTVGSLLCGLSPDVYWLIFFRSIQAVGAAMIMALAMAIITEAFPPQERGKALGIMGTIVSVGIAMGPSLGGFIIEFLSWHWIFFVNLPVGIVGTLMVIKFVADVRPTGHQKFDIWGALILFVCLLALLIGMTIGQQLTFNHPLVYALLVVWFVLLVLFIVVEWKTQQPMINLRLFKNSVFSINLTNGFISFFGLSGIFILQPFYLQNIMGYSSIKVGLLMCVVPVMLGCTAPIAGILSDRFGTRSIILIGLLFLLVGFWAVSTLSEKTTALEYILCVLPLGIGIGVFQSGNNSAIMGAVPKEYLGISSGLLSITRTMGQTVGIAVLGAIWAGRTFFYAGYSLAGGATQAPHLAQILALQDTFSLISLLMVGAIILCIWGIIRPASSEKITK